MKTGNENGEWKQNGSTNENGEWKQKWKRGMEMKTEWNALHTDGISADYRMEWSKPLPLFILLPGHHPALVTFNMEKQGRLRILSCK